MMAKLEKPNAAPSLADFAKDIKPSRQCILCSVPEDIEAQARAGKAAGITYPVLGDWLVALNYADAAKPPRQSRLQRHFQDGHIHPSANNPRSDS
jgi:hypothetical protein